MDQFTDVCADGEGHKATLEIGSKRLIGHYEKLGTDLQGSDLISGCGCLICRSNPPETRSMDKATGQHATSYYICHTNLLLPDHCISLSLFGLLHTNILLHFARNLQQPRKILLEPEHTYIAASQHGQLSRHAAARSISQGSKTLHPSR